MNNIIKNRKLTNLEGIKCWLCNKMDFTISTPSGADYITCPLCNSSRNDPSYESDSDDNFPL